MQGVVATSEDDGSEVSGERDAVEGASDEQVSEAAAAAKFDRVTSIGLVADVAPVLVLVQVYESMTIQSQESYFVFVVKKEWSF